MSVHTFPLSGEIENMNAYSHVITINPIDCTPTCTLTTLAGCSDLHNCQEQSTANNYFNPLIEGDTFMFQLRFLDRHNTDPENPDDGWGIFVVAELLDNNGDLISDDHTEFASRYLVGWDGSSSYQLIEIDFDLLRTNYPNLVCFSFKFVAYRYVEDLAIEVDHICSQHFQDAIPCQETVLIHSIMTTDCCDNYYGSPVAFVGNANFKYSNKWRYYAGVRRTNTEFEKQVFGVKRTKVEIDRIFLLQLKRKIPPYLFILLTEIHLAGERFFVDDIEYFIDSFSFTNESERKMFIGRIELFQECNKDYQCN